MDKKVTVIGAGNVGAMCAQRLYQQSFADVVLVDIVEGLPQGKAIDIMHSGPIVDSNVKIIGTNSYEETSNSDVVVITSGLPRKPGMSRDDLLFNNMKIIKSVVENIIRYSPDCVIIVVTNPLDAMAQLALHLTKFPRNRVMGMGGVLDTARFGSIISAELNVSVEDVSTCILGAHGDTMVPIPRLSKVGCIPLIELVSEETLNRIMKRSTDSGVEIVSLLKTGSAFYAPATAAAHMVKAIILDTKRIMLVSAYLNGEYSLKDVFIGVPVKLGKKGIEQIYEIKLTAEEKSALKKSAQSVVELVNLMKLS